jgi:cysteine desulfurase
MEVYLDNAASTKLDPIVAKTMLLDTYANPSSVHKLGKEARQLLENSRKIIAKSLNAEPEEIYFTSGGTESNNLAIKGILSATNKTHIITSVIEHPSVLNVCKSLNSVTYLPVNERGYINVEELRSAINDNTALVTIMHANNELGVVQDIKTIAEICKKKNVPFHTDAVQSFKKILIDVKRFQVSALSVSAHKIHGPKGIGAIYIRKGTNINPMMLGGSQENSLRPGTENVTAILGFAAATQMPLDVKNITKLRDYFISLLKEISNTKINSRDLCNIVNVSFKGVPASILLEHLNQNNIYASTGSACSSNKIEPSYVLKAINAEDSVRFSLSKYTTKEEIDYTIKHLKEIILPLRDLNDINKRGYIKRNKK